MLVGQRTAGEGGGGGGGGQGQQDGRSLIRVVANGELREQVLNQVQQRCQPPFHLLLARILSPNLQPQQLFYQICECNSLILVLTKGN